MSWKSELWRKYGLTPDDYEALFQSQGRVCAICMRPRRARDPRLAVDHDHLSGKVRGLLCHRCNHTLLGMFGETPGLYRRAATYLLDPPASAVLGGPHYVPEAPPRTEG